MAHERGTLPLICFFLVILASAKQSASARVFTIVNSCKETIWPAFFPGQIYSGGGFALKSGQSLVFTAPVGWVGRMWARTGCKFDQAGNGICQTGSCGSTLNCTDPGKPPASLAEFNLASRDFYDISLVDGFNLPLTIVPLNGSGNCNVTGCDGDLRSECPSELSLKEGGKTVACRSACNVYDSDQYCCRGLYNSPIKCLASNYSKQYFKKVCPTAYSYAYDDRSSLFTCSGADYVVAFCSDREKSVCTYHDKKLGCSGSNGFKSMTNWRWTVMVVISILIAVWNF